MRRLRHAMESLTLAARGVTVIIPTLDEAESIVSVIDSIPREIVQQIVIADGGSRDLTAVLAQAAGAEVIAAGRGYGRACYEGARHSTASDILVFMDGDGADNPQEIGTLIAPIQAGTHDFVIGSRTRGRRETGSMAWHQVAAGRIAGTLIGALYRVRFTDMCAFRAIRRETLLTLGMCELTYGWNLEMQMRAARSGLRVLEIPVANRRRHGGASKVSGTWQGTLRAGGQIMATFARVALSPDAHRITVESQGSSNG